ncbi:MAG: class I SAM-dependent methyltransferase [Lentisphaerae bacterium]|nr:class I SAM-dependent methyltransferase [Lentisphaerota bacterium]
MVTESDLGPEAKRDLSLFRRRLSLQVMLQEVMRFVEVEEGQAGLDLGACNAFMSHHLRKLGGEWQTVVLDSGREAAARAVLGDAVHVWGGIPLPFEDKSFDVLVVLDYLERAESPEEFVAECHRILKPDGRLVVNVVHIKPWSLVRGFRALLGLSYDKLGLKRPGYSESRLFNLLKHGFDVHEVRSYSRFFLEVTDAVVAAAVNRVRRSGADVDERQRRVYAGAAFFYRLAYQLDMLLFFTRGNRLMAVAKRRGWRPRNAPVLSDGRTITEAVLQRPGV